MKKLVFCCLPGFDTFIKPMAERLQKHFQVDLVMGNSLQEYQAKLMGADIIWLEWANQLAGAITQNLLPIESAKKVILRLHSYEALTPGMLEQINYGAITDLLFVSNYIRDYTLGLSPQTFEHLTVHTVPNGLDLDQFPILEGHVGVYDKDDIKVAMLGHLNGKKGPMLLAQAMYELKARVPAGKTVSFKIGGQWQDPRHEAYMMHFLEKSGLLLDVDFHQVPYGTANKFYQDVDVVLCTSPWESQNMSVMEGMAAGCKPAIHHFPGADYHYRFDNLWLTFQELQEIVYSNPFEPAVYREQVEAYDIGLITDKVRSELLD